MGALSGSDPDSEPRTPMEPNADAESLEASISVLTFAPDSDSEAPSQGLTDSESEYGYVKVNLRLVGAAGRIVGLDLRRHCQWGWGWRCRRHRFYY